MSEDIEPPESDELFEEQSPGDVEVALQKAQQYHAMMDQSKVWARETAADLRVRAANESDEEAIDEILQAAQLVTTVVSRIEQGDNTRSRQP